jgi:hypothetical protein
LGRPIQLGLRLPTSRTEALFAEFVAETESVYDNLLSKRDIEKWCVHVPCGADRLW